MNKILIVEDDNDINAMIKTHLTNCGYECISAFSGTEALLQFKTEAFGLIILDLMLPGMTGQEVLQKVRETSEVPVIVLSAKDELDTKVDLLDIGANDYITKPFELKELQARVKVQLRNVPHDNKSENKNISYKELCFDKEKMLLFVGKEPVTLTAQELKIMELLMNHPGKVFSKNEIYEFAWEDYYIGEDKTINVHISNIRSKIKRVTDTEYIETVWGLGFKLM